MLAGARCAVHLDPDSMSLSSKWAALLVICAFLYASRDHFHLARYVQEISKSPKGGNSDNENCQLRTGFIQARNISIRPVADGPEEGTHVVSLSVNDLAPLASFFAPAPTGVVHFMASTLKFFEVGSMLWNLCLDRELVACW